jgi:hypothetical protein
MRIVCAWCESEGRPSILGEKAPLDSEHATHTICGPHLDILKRELQTRTDPDRRPDAHDSDGRED